MTSRRFLIFVTLILALLGLGYYWQCNYRFQWKTQQQLRTIVATKAAEEEVATVIARETAAGSLPSSQDQADALADTLVDTDATADVVVPSTLATSRSPVVSCVIDRVPVPVTIALAVLVSGLLIIGLLWRRRVNR